MTLPRYGYLQVAIVTFASFVLSESTEMAALSLRGQQYSKASYNRGLQNLFHPVANPGGIVSFSNAENYLMEPDLLAYFNNHTQFLPATCSYNQGMTGTVELNSAMASHINTYFAPVTPIASGDITWAAGVTALNEMLTMVLCDEGDAILIGSTVYGSFNKDLTMRTAAKLEYVTFGTVDPFSVEAVAVYEHALLEARATGKSIKALLICNPHNPLGQTYPPATLASLLAFAAKYNIHLVSDEIYALSVFPVAGRQLEPFTSVLALPTPRPDLVHVLYGMSKDFACAGMRLGCLVSRSTSLHTALRPTCRFAGPSEFSMALATRLLSDQPFVTSFLRTSSARLAVAYARTTTLLDAGGLTYHRKGNAGFFIWLDLRPFMGANDSDRWDAEAKLSERFTKAGVVMAAGAAYHAEQAGYFRLTFAAEDGRVEEGIRRIRAVLGI